MAQKDLCGIQKQKQKPEKRRNKKLRKKKKKGILMSITCVLKSELIHLMRKVSYSNFIGGA